jgi:hypothetical protein
VSQVKLPPFPTPPYVRGGKRPLLSSGWCQAALTRRRLPDTGGWQIQFERTIAIVEARGFWFTCATHKEARSSSRRKSLLQAFPSDRQKGGPQGHPVGGGILLARSRLGMPIRSNVPS